MLSTTQLIILGVLFLIILVIVLKMDNPVYEYYNSIDYNNIYYNNIFDGKEIDYSDIMKTKTETINNNTIYKIPYIKSGKPKTVFILCPENDVNNIEKIKTMNIEFINDNNIWINKFNDDNVNSEINKFYNDKNIKYMKIDLNIGVIPMNDINGDGTEIGYLNIKFLDSTPIYYKIGTRDYINNRNYETPTVANSSSNTPMVQVASSKSIIDYDKLPSNKKKLLSHINNQDMN